MGRTDLQLLDAHWGHEPLLQKLLIHKETIFRFMESLHLLLHTHWDLEPFVSEDAPVFPLSAFRFPLFPHGSWRAHGHGRGRSRI